MTEADLPISTVERTASRRALALAWYSRQGWMSPLAVVVVVVPSVLMVARFMAHHGPYSNWGDGAATELSVQNATRFHQEVGPYDRFGWYHPGPFLFYLLAVPYALMGWNGAGLPVGTTLINLASAVGIVVIVARRAGGTAALGTAALVCTFESVMQVQYVTDVWGPVVVTLPAAFFLVLCADLAAGSVWSVVGATVVGTFLVQTDISTASAVIPGLILAVGARVVVWRRAGHLGGSLRQFWPTGVVAVGVAAVLWAPPVWQQLTGRRGNLEHLVGFFIRHPGQHGAHEALSALANGMLNQRIGLNDQVGFFHHYDIDLIVFVVVAAGLSLVCWRRQQWLALALASGSIAVTAAVCISLLRVLGPVFGYLVFWSRALALCVGIAAVLCITGLLRGARRPQGWSQQARIAGSIVLAACAVFTSWRLSDSVSRFQPGEGVANVTAASTAVERLLAPDARRVLVCVTTAAAWPTSAGVVANLAKDGRDPRVNPEWLHVFGEQLTPSGRENVAVFLSDPRQRSVLDGTKVRTTTVGGDLVIGIYAPRHGYVSSAECPPVRQ